MRAWLLLIAAPLVGAMCYTPKQVDESAELKAKYKCQDERGNVLTCCAAKEGTIANKNMPAPEAGGCKRDDECAQGQTCCNWDNAAGSAGSGTCANMCTQGGHSEGPQEVVCAQPALNVTVVEQAGQRKYVLGVIGGSNALDLALGARTYTFTDIPESHPMNLVVHNPGSTSSNCMVKLVECETTPAKLAGKDPSGAAYDREAFCYGKAAWSVSAECSGMGFKLECGNHANMGSEIKLRFDASCTNQPPQPTLPPTTQKPDETTRITREPEEAQPVRPTGLVREVSMNDTILAINQHITIRFDLSFANGGRRLEAGHLDATQRAELEKTVGDNVIAILIAAHGDAGLSRDSIAISVGPTVLTVTITWPIDSSLTVEDMESAWGPAGTLRAGVIDEAAKVGLTASFLSIETISTETTCDHFADGASTADVGKPVCMRTEAEPLAPGKLVKVCRPATLPEAIDPLAITSATVRSTALHLTRSGKSPCPSDMTLEIASYKAAPLKACECDEYDEALIAGLPGGIPKDEASLIRALPDTLCMKTHSEIIPAAGYRASRKTICQAVGAGYPRVGVEDGGGLTWHGCRADAVPCANKEKAPTLP